LLARVYLSPDGGPLSVSGVGRVDTNATRARLAWVEVGRVPAHAATLRLHDEGALQGVDALALVDDATLAAAREASAQRLAGAPTTILGRGASLPAVVTVPAPGDYALWLRVPRGASPQVTLDGVARDAPSCAAACGEPAEWVKLDVGHLDAGAHALALEGAPVDAVALSSDPAFAARPDAPVAWTRASATEYHAHVDQGGLLALAVPFDAGWVARVDGHAIRAIPVDGVANGFLLPPGAHDVL